MYLFEMQNSEWSKFLVFKTSVVKSGQMFKLIPFPLFSPLPPHLTENLSQTNINLLN